jgi:hypothetical protein
VDVLLRRHVIKYKNVKDFVLLFLHGCVVKRGKKKDDKRNLLYLYKYIGQGFCIINTLKKYIKRQKEMVDVQIS